MSYGIGRRCGSDPEFLWLWCRWVATALIRPLAWEPPYAEGVALKSKRKKKKKMEPWFEMRCSVNKYLVLLSPGSRMFTMPPPPKILAALLHLSFATFLSQLIPPSGLILGNGRAGSKLWWGAPQRCLPHLPGGLQVLGVQVGVSNWEAGCWAHPPSSVQQL